MPLLRSGQTSLRTVVGTLGLSNFQLLQCLMAMVFLLYAADGAMLPSIFKALEEGMTGATPVSLGGIVFVEAICHSSSVLVWGLLADRFDKLGLLLYATIAWGVVTLATAFVTGISSLFIVRSLAGIVGAAMGPLSQGLIAAVCAPSERGRAFGFLIACGQLGYMFGVLLAGSTAHLKAIAGWRGSFAIFAMLTLAIGWVLRLVRIEVSRGLFKESRTWAQLAAAKKRVKHRREWTMENCMGDVVQDMDTILRRKSFWVLILQGAFASTTVKAMTYQTMWYQYLGFSDLMSSTITGAVPLGCIFGALASGHISDKIASRYPRHGRIFFGQATSFIMFWILFYAFIVDDSPSPDQRGSTYRRIAVSFLFGFFSIMPYTAVVKPLFAEIVPSQMVAQVIAIAAAFDGAFSAMASTPVVGFITQHVFSYKSTSASISAMSESTRKNNAEALGNSIAAVTLVSTFVTVFSLTLLHLTYPQDSQRSRIADAEALPAVEDGDEESTASEAIDEEEQPLLKPLEKKRVSFNFGREYGGTEND